MKVGIFLTAILTNLTLVVWWRHGVGEVVHATYGRLPGLRLTLTLITGKGFTIVSAIMGCL